ncbi:cytochrome P450 [Thermocatellispora tengchongensis]|nr:cytochrome P450 [Thermocatellispora tengchongensis]
MPVPGPAGLPLLGSVLDLRRDLMNTFLRAQREHGDVVRFTAGPPGLRAVLYGVFSADGAQQVLGGDPGRFRKDNVFYNEVRECVGNGLLTSQDADYLRQRRLVQPLFTRRQVDRYATVMCEETQATIDRWRAAPNRTIDVIDEMTRLTLRVVGRVLFGADVDAAVDVVRRSFPVIGEYTLRRGNAPVRVPRQWPTPANRRAAAAQQELYALCDQIIAARQAAGAGGDDLLGLLARATGPDGDSLDPAEIRDQVLVFLLAGYETTATSLAFALHLLARHPETRERAQAEIDAVLGGRMPEAADLDALPYTTMVLKEAMRLYPAAPVIGRMAVTDVEIGGHRIPSGANVLVSPWVTHRHPAYWEEPERFDPERFTPEREAARPRYAWFPFGGGPRACIGRHFSMLESVLALAMVLRTYDLDAVDTAVPLEQGITLRAKGPARCRLTARQPRP